MRHPAGGEDLGELVAAVYVRGTTTIVAPALSAITVSNTDASKLGEAKCSAAPSASPGADPLLGSQSARPRWVSRQPLRLPVEPARVDQVGRCGRHAGDRLRSASEIGWPARPRRPPPTSVSSSTTHLTSRDSLPAHRTVTPHRGTGSRRASALCAPRIVSGPPARRPRPSWPPPTPRAHDTDRDSPSATYPFRPGSHRDQCRANLFAPSSSCRYVSSRPSHTTARHRDCARPVRAIGHRSRAARPGAARGRQAGQFVLVQDPDITERAVPDRTRRPRRFARNDRRSLHGLRANSRVANATTPEILRALRHRRTAHRALTRVPLTIPAPIDNALEPHPGQLDASALVVSGTPGDLEQRRIRMSNWRGRVPPRPLERHVGVREGTESTLRTDSRSSRTIAAHRLSCGARGSRRTFRQIVEGPLSTPRDGSTDHDVVGVPQPGEQHRQAAWIVMTGSSRIARERQSRRCNPGSSANSTRSPRRACWIGRGRSLGNPNRSGAPDSPLGP